MQLEKFLPLLSSVRSRRISLSETGCLCGDAAKGLSYLDTGLKPVISHRRNVVKSLNG